MKQILLGSVLILLCHKNCAAGNPDYVLIKQGFWGEWKIVHVEKPKKKLHKWYHDKKTDTYYRMRTWIGIAVRIR